jgi:hypothetical protein
MLAIIVVVLISIVLFIFWCVQFVSLMEMSDDEFSGKNDKLIWALAMLLTSFVGAFLFWLNKTPYHDDPSSENHGLTKDEIEMLRDSAERYKTLSEQFPLYKEYFMLAAAMIPTSDRKAIVRKYFRCTTEKLKRKFHNGPNSLAEGAYGILIAELIRREIDIKTIDKTEL